MWTISIVFAIILAVAEGSVAVAQVCASPVACVTNCTSVIDCDSGSSCVGGACIVSSCASLQFVAFPNITTCYDALGTDDVGLCNSDKCNPACNGTTDYTPCYKYVSDGSLKIRLGLCLSGVCELPPPCSKQYDSCLVTDTRTTIPTFGTLGSCDQLTPASPLSCTLYSCDSAPDFAACYLDDFSIGICQSDNCTSACNGLSDGTACGGTALCINGTCTEPSCATKADNELCYTTQAGTCKSLTCLTACTAQGDDCVTPFSLPGKCRLDNTCAAVDCTFAPDGDSCGTATGICKYGTCYEVTCLNSGQPCITVGGIRGVCGGGLACGSLETLPGADTGLVIFGISEAQFLIESSGAIFIPRVLVEDGLTLSVYSNVSVDSFTITSNGNLVPYTYSNLSLLLTINTTGSVDVNMIIIIESFFDPTRANLTTRGAKVQSLLSAGSQTFRFVTVSPPETPTLTRLGNGFTNSIALGTLLDLDGAATQPDYPASSEKVVYSLFVRFNGSSFPVELDTSKAFAYSGSHTFTLSAKNWYYQGSPNASFYLLATDSFGQVSPLSPPIKDNVVLQASQNPSKDANDTLKNTNEQDYSKLLSALTVAATYGYDIDETAAATTILRAVDGTGKTSEEDSSLLRALAQEFDSYSRRKTSESTNLDATFLDFSTRADQLLNSVKNAPFDDVTRPASTDLIFSGALGLVNVYLRRNGNLSEHHLQSQAATPACTAKQESTILSKLQAAVKAQVAGDWKFFGTGNPSSKTNEKATLKTGLSQAAVSSAAACITLCYRSKAATGKCGIAGAIKGAKFTNVAVVTASLVGSCMAPFAKSLGCAVNSKTAANKIQYVLQYDLDEVKTSSKITKLQDYKVSSKKFEGHAINGIPFPQPLVANPNYFCAVQLADGRVTFSGVVTDRATATCYLQTAGWLTVVYVVPGSAPITPNTPISPASIVTPIVPVSDTQASSTPIKDNGSVNMGVALGVGVGLGGTVVLIAIVVAIYLFSRAETVKAAIPKEMQNEYPNEQNYRPPTNTPNQW